MRQSQPPTHGTYLKSKIGQGLRTIMKVTVVLGTRPEIIKMAPLVKKLGRRCSLIFTGQHHDYNMGLQFIEELGLCRPDHFLKISPGDPATQISEIIAKLSKILSATRPEMAMVQGDTNTVLAASIAALKSGVRLAHVEAGLRSFDWRMPEEHNRIVADHVSELLFAPTSTSQKNLKNENAHGRIFVTGNTVIDSAIKYSKISAKKSTLEPPRGDYTLMTLHRAENVDDKATLSAIVSAVLGSEADFVFPTHPRTLKRLREFGLYERLKRSENVSVTGPVGYFESLELMKNCSFILTDSGGIQEEATAPGIRKKVLIVRKTTDRPESVRAGLAEVTGTGRKNIARAISRAVRDPRIYSRHHPFGAGRASEKIMCVLRAL